MTADAVRVRRPSEGAHPDGGLHQQVFKTGALPMTGGAAPCPPHLIVPAWQVAVVSGHALVHMRVLAQPQSVLD